MAISLQKGTGGGARGKLGSRSFADPLGLRKKEKKVVKTAEELAIERTTRSLLDKEISESEKRFKALARGKLGRQSLLSGAAATTEEAARGRGGAGAGGVGSLLGGGRTGRGRASSSQVIQSGRIK